VRVTEASVMNTGRFVGRGDKNAADKAAVEGMRELLNTIQMDGVIVIGEGEKDEVPMLYNGERLGTGEPPQVDIAVDPIDGTRPLAQGLSNTICAVAMAPRGSMFNPGPFLYMDKIAVGRQARAVIDIRAPIQDNLAQIARATGKDIEDLTVVVLDRARHQGLITEVRLAGARLRMIPDGDVAAALMTCLPETGIDVLLGVGGSAEGVIAACALRCMGGGMQVRLIAPSQGDIRRGHEMGYNVGQILTLEELIHSDDIFFSATGITTGDLLRGVDYYANGARTDSLVMRGLTGTVRRITADHRLDKLSRIRGREY
jgi:fructose-1,6-bisphosphatase II